MAGGNLNYDRALNDGLQSRIDAEDEIRKGKHVGCGIQIIQPHLRNVTNYDPFSVRIVIDNLIAKFNQNFKEEQYSHGDTLSLIYLNDHNFPLYGLGTIKQKMLPIYFDDAPIHLLVENFGGLHLLILVIIFLSRLNLRGHPGLTVY